MRIQAVANVIKTFFSLSLRPDQIKLEYLSQTVLLGKCNVLHSGIPLL
jgi:hypothetical protein